VTGTYPTAVTDACRAPARLDPYLPLCFLGAGAMASALIQGLLAAKLARPGEVRVTNRSNSARLEDLARSYGVQAHPGKAEALRGARLVVLATKPADALACLEESRPHLEAARAEGGRPPLLVSLAAGLDTETLETLLPPGTPIVRAMPNTSCAVGESATVIAAGRSAGPPDLEAARRLFGAVGLVVELGEELLDAVTGLSGSGPAYVYLLLEALTEAGASLGMDRRLAYQLALQTLRGAAVTAELTGEEPAALRRKVTSPGGTTIAALEVLEKARFREGLSAAVRRAAERASELSRELRGKERR